MTEREIIVLRDSARAQGLRVKNDKGWMAYVSDDLKAGGLLARRVDGVHFVYEITEAGRVALESVALGVEGEP